MARMRQLQDFVGFQFNGRHSSEFGLKVVSNSNRFQDNFGPTFKDSTVKVPGGDGNFYWNTEDDKKEWNLNVAFDDVSEAELREIRQWLNSKAMGELIFDEEPYKAYKVKMKSPAQFKYLCFDEVEEVIARTRGDTEEFVRQPDLYNRIDGSWRMDLNNDGTLKEYAITVNGIWILTEPIGKYPKGTRFLGWFYEPRDDEVDYNLILKIPTRVYKGEGTIAFVAYQPYAESVYEDLELYDSANYPNKDEWAAASGISSAPRFEDTSVSIYNPGDLETDWTFRFPRPSQATTITISKWNNATGATIAEDILEFDLPAKMSTETTLTQFIEVSSRTQLIRLLNGDYTFTTTLFNNSIQEEDFFKIPVTTDPSKYSVQISGVNPSGPDVSFKYKYLYY